MIELMASDLFMHDGYDVVLGATSDMDAVGVMTAGDMLTITAMGPTEGDGALITVTGTATGMSSVKGTQIAENIAEVKFHVMVDMLPAAESYTLSIEDMNLVEGMSAKVIATASSPVPEDVMIEVMRDRSMSSADDDDFMLDPMMITIMAEGTMGYTMVTATDDGMMENEGNMAEELVLYGMVDGMETNSVKFYVWDAAVPALPIIAQLLLAAFLAVGGYRRYRRR